VAGAKSKTQNKIEQPLAGATLAATPLARGFLPSTEGAIVKRRIDLRGKAACSIRAAGGERGGSFQLSSFHGLVEVLQPIAVPGDVEGWAFSFFITAAFLDFEGG
jgi:hypothetical protein